MHCDCTSSKGLTILPVNYCAIPKVEGLKLPSWANHPDITKAKLKYNYDYALRVVREGFLYLFYEEGARGSNYWEVYRIAENGSFWKQLSTQMASAEEDCGCAATLQNTASAEFICIEQPKQCGKVWLAYSEHKWQDDVLENYETNSQLRSERMTMFEPKNMAAGAIADEKGIAQLNQQNIKQIIDYADKDIKSKIADPTIKHFNNLVSDDINQWNAKFLDNHCTAFPWAVDRHLNNTIESVSQRSIEPSGYIVGLMDAVGIAYELNGWCNEIVGYLQLFSEEREHEIQSDALLTFFENSFIQSTEDERRKNLNIYEEMCREKNNYWLEEVIKTEGTDWLQKRRGQYYNQYRFEPDMLAGLNKGRDLFEDWIKDSRVVSSNYRRLDLVMKRVQSNKDIKAYLKTIAKLRKDAELTIAIRELMHKTEVDKIRTIPREEFKKYQARINQPLRDTYHQKYEQIMKQAGLLHEQRSENVFIWIQSDNYLNALNDYSQNNIEDGIEFERVVVTAIDGVQDTKIGNDIIGEWIKAREIPKTNLLWRAVAFNQNGAVKELEEFLLDAEKRSKVDGEGRLIHILFNTPNNLSNFTGICQEINANLQKKKPNANVKFIDKFAYKRDKLASILIGKFFRIKPISVVVGNMRIAADHINHFIAQKIFMARAGLEPEVVNGVMHEDYIRRTWVDRMKQLNIDNRMFSGPFPQVGQRGMRGMLINSYLKNYTHNILRKVIIKRAEKPDDIIIKRKHDEMWGNHNNQSFGRNLKDTRLSAVLLVFQLPVIATLFIQKDNYNGDEFTNLVLSASLSLVSSFTNVLIKPVEISFKSTKLVTRLRIAGHLTSGVSSIFGLLYAIPQITKENQDNIEKSLNVLNVAVYVSQFIKSSSALLALSNRLASRIIIKQFIIMAGFRVFTFFATWWVQLILMVVDFVRTLIVDDDIQKWIRATRFGTQYDRDVSPNFDAELTAFKKLIKIEENQEKVEQATDSFLTYIGWDSSIFSDFSLNNILGIDPESNSQFQLNTPYSLN
ncbi:T6SS effector BTH_I2691 family protein [Gilliamella sp. App4-10]|uniref:T6SS effector BTH_I2691 family protein n=1 Tax=Gilliamella sp. App4-10 TaxID=3120231 RepID=UPI00080E0C94|nr:T6SS effector BTH_I2691 family protein [Gilliamella apicola]OCG21605.1 hypothetical protein A9G23_04345 [Gilliamella apicola]